MPTKLMRQYGPPVELWPIIKPDTLPSYPDQLNIAEILLDANVAKGFGSRIAILYEGTRLTYEELLLRVNRLGQGLKSLGVEPGDRVVLKLPNIPEFIVSSLAIQKVGGICVPIHPQLKSGEITRIANDSEAKFLMTTSSYLEDVVKAMSALTTVNNVVVIGSEDKDLRPGFFSYEEMVNTSRFPPHLEAEKVDQDEIALLLYTSGTTGQPKGCIHTHRDYLSVADGYGRQVLKARGDDVFGGVPSLAFAYGHTGLLGIPLRFGATVSLMDKFDPERCFALIEEHRITVFYGVPTAYRMMLAKVPDAERKYNLRSLRVAVTAGEPSPPSLYYEWVRRTGVEMLEHLGTTEMFDGIISSKFGGVRPGSVGLPVPGYEVRVVGDDGKVCPPLTPGSLAVVGPTGTRYWKDSRKQAESVKDGWNYTGDMAYHDTDGYLWYMGRRDDVIKSAGYRISPFEVEETIREHPDVLEVAVVGIPDPMRGQRVKAFVVLREKDHASPELAQEIISYVKERIAAYKVPRELEFRNHLPKTVTGKLLRQELVKADLHNKREG